MGKAQFWSLISSRSDGRNRSHAQDSTETKSGGHPCRGWGRQREGHTDGLVSSKEGSGWRGGCFWLEERPEGDGEACVGGGRRPPARTSRGSRGGGVCRTLALGAPRSWTGLPLRNLSRGPSPFPKAPVLKSPRHLRLQEGKEPEKRIADHMDLFPGFKKNPSN